MLPRTTVYPGGGDMAIGRNPAVAALALLVAAPSCKSDAPAPPPHLEVYGRDIVAGWANVAVRRDGAPVLGANVVVNGAVLADAQFEAGTYSGQLPATLSPGDPVTLDVTSGDLRVTGTGAYPDVPVIEAAYTSAAAASDGDVIVTWSSPSNPDSFEVWASWSCGPSCGTGRSFTAAGSARTLTIPVGSLPPGADVQIAVFAYDDGSLEGDYTPWAGSPGMNIRAESGSLPISTGRTSPPPPTLQVRGQDMGGYWENIIVARNNTPIDDAVVVVNGQVIPHSPAARGLYVGTLQAPLSPGDAVVLDVTSGAIQVRGVGMLPHAPVLTAPSSGAVVRQGQDVVVTWASPSDPEYFEVSANWSCGALCGTGTSFGAAGQARTLRIPAGSIPVLGPVDLQVFAYDDGAFSGDYSPYLPYPGMNIRAESNTVTVEVTAP
jgi:hypothetical protein